MAQSEHRQDGRLAQREGMCWGEVSNEHWLRADKRIVGHLFLVWLAANLNPHPCRRLRIAKKPPPRPKQPLWPGTATLPSACCDGCLDDDAEGLAKGAVPVPPWRCCVLDNGAWDVVMAGRKAHAGGLVELQACQTRLPHGWCAAS
ncbi:hypothetical protein J1614_006608 [Plenodomus biglobosus]|nr:hypothetical protein J1614_006608 [Plenodomus biglobosus]